jgi:precorrin-2 dehydrogenase/sirohydrochlorin ferrochelatase
VGSLRDVADEPENCRPLARSSYIPLYAANLVLKDVGALVVGGGEVALRKTRSLLESQARVTVVAPEFHAAFGALMRAKNLRLVRRVFQAKDLKGARLVFAATHDTDLNARIARLAHAKGLLVNAAAPPEAGNFHVPASIRRGRLSIAISTGGASAALARSLREEIEKKIGGEWSELAGLLEQRRSKLLESMDDAGARHDLLRELGSAKWARRVKQRGAKSAGREMDKLILASQKRVRR